jgi:hypothetical protein
LNHLKCGLLVYKICFFKWVNLYRYTSLAGLDINDNNNAAAASGSPSVSFTADALNDAAYRHWSENVLETCKHCQRTFTPEAGLLQVESSLPLA